MNDYALYFSVYNKTDPPPVKTPGYLQTIDALEFMKEPDDLELKPSSTYTALIPTELIENPLNKYILNIFLQFIPTPVQSPNMNITSKVKSHKGFLKFQQDLANYELATGDYMDSTKKAVLTTIAYLESRFLNTASNPVSSAAGYFLVINSNRKLYGTKEQYLHDINALFESASKLYDLNKKSYEQYFKLAKEKGLNSLETMYGFWFNPSSMIKYLNSGKDNFSDKLGTTLLKIFNRIKTEVYGKL